MDKKDKPIIDVEDPIFPVDQAAPDYDPIFQEESETSAVTVDADSKITPISREEIPQVDAAEWNKMSIPDLYDQLNTLELRKFHCNTYAPLIAGDIERGIKLLRAIINRKQGTEVKLL